MQVRAKFKVRSVKKVKNSAGEEEICEVMLDPVYSGSEENKQFFKWTPSGHITIGTINPAAAAQFVEGREMYVDFTPAE